MRKTYQMILALALIMLGATNALGQKIYRAELDPSYFKAWTSNEPGAQEDTNPAPEPKSNNPFACENNLFTTVNAYGTIYGSSNVYYLWYADITGTKTMTVKGTPGMKIRVMMNRVPFVEGGTGDADGGAYVELIQEISNDGYTVFDLSSYEYLHLNAIKVPGGATGGVVRSIELEGTVKPVTGILSMINNGDAEGDDLGSFPVSYDGPNNGGTANDKPEIVGGGVNGSKCFKVVSFPEPTETWHTQFYVKSDEELPKGTKWALKMSVKADRNTKITTSAQGEPRAWKGGFISEFAVTTDWQQYTWTGEIGVDGFQSIAFDLNNSDERNANDDGWTPGNGTCGFYFDNIEFGIDLGIANPMSEITTAYGGDAICINLANRTNMKTLVAASKVQTMVEGVPVNTLIYPNDCASVEWNGKKCNIVSVEGRSDGNLYVFLLDMDGEGGTDFAEDANVKVSFKNPEDAEHHLEFTEGKWAGEPVPNFDGLVCSFIYELSEGAIFSYMWGAPTVEKVVPEDGSFNLPADTKEFTVTFSQRVDAATVVAKLGNEALTVSPAEGLTKVITLTRTGEGDLAGVQKLVISHAMGEKEQDLEEAITVKYSFGLTTLDGDDQPQVIYQDDFAASENPGDGWRVNADAGGLQEANTGGGCRLMHSQGAFLEDLLYLAQRGTPAAQGGVALYGIVDGKKLALEAGKNYHLTLGACKHDRDGVALRVQVLPEDAVSTEDGTILDETQILVQDYKEVTPAKTSKDATRFDLAIPVKTDGNYVIRLVPSKSDGTSGGYDGCVCIGDIKVEYIPDIMGLVEMKALATSLDNAKATLANNEDERYQDKDYAALDAEVKEYDGKVMTAPSAYNEAVKSLDEKNEAMKNYRKLCDEYDALPEQLFNLYAQFKDSKFNVTALFAQIKPMVDKYCTIENQVVVDDEGNEVSQDVVTGHKIIKDAAEMETAKTELSELITSVSKTFTEGKSHNLYGGGDRTSGYAALHERLRRGVELLKSLGVEADAPEIVAANAELGDSDEIAEAIMKRASLVILNDLASADSKLFAGTVDEVTEEVTAPTYDLSVYAKNPNIYSPAYSTELPGWTSARGNCYVFPGWGAEHTEKTQFAEDCQIHAGWHPSAYPMTEQTIENLPAGVYSIKIDGSDNNSEVSEGTCGFVKLSDTPEMGADDVLDPDVHFAGYVSCSGTIEGIVVADGKLTVGFSYGPGSQAFINDIEITMTGAIAGHKYADDYNKILSGIDVTTVKPAQVRRIELFDLNGRRISNARKGIAIVKKYMNDGTVKTEKVVVK